MNTMKWIIINSSKDLQFQELLPVTPFKLNANSVALPSMFEIVIFIEDTKYRYGFKADKHRIKSEWLFTSKKIKEYKLFIREGEEIDVSQKFKDGEGLEEKQEIMRYFFLFVHNSMVKYLERF